VNPFEFLDELFIAKTRVLGLSDGEDFVILACVVLTQCQPVTDGQTDGQTDRTTDGQPDRKQAMLTPVKTHESVIIVNVIGASGAGDDLSARQSNQLSRTPQVIQLRRRQ